MSSQARSRIKRMKAERFGGSGGNDFPDVQIHAQAQQLQLVDQRDVDAAVDVFEELGHLGRGGRGDGNGAMEDGSVESAGQLRSLWIQSADNFRDIATGEIGRA